MSNNQSSLLCSLGGWGLAILAGILGAVLLMIMGDWRLIQAIFAAVVITILVGGFMTWVICRPLPAMGEMPASRSVPNPVPSSRESAAAAAAQAREGAEPAPATPAAAAASAARAGVKPSAALAGEAELAGRKGSWSYNSDDAAGGKTPPAASATADKAAADKAAADKAAAQKAAADKAAAEKAAASKASADKAAADKAASEKAAASKAAASSSAATAGEDYDGDGVREGTSEGTRPVALDGPRGGKADNLKEIKGIGPKLELLCHTLGFYHFDQIAGWTADEVAWVDANLEGFKGRVSRDKWVEQAGVLASGGETEFSKRVDDGDVY